MRKRTHKSADVHSDWLSQVDIDGPFLAHPVLKDMWPSGVDRLGDTDDRLITFKQAYTQWQRAFDHYDQQPRTSESKEAYDAVRRAWIDVVLNDLAEWNDLLSVSDVTVRSPGEQITVAATSALKGREDETAALLLVCEPTSGLRDAGLDGWAANEIDRLAMLLRKAQVEVGIVTDGQWWALVWAEEGKPTGSGVVNALTWAEEPLLRDAFLTLINQRRFRASDAEQRLTRLFERSELEAEEITEALGTQVRRSVELLIQAFSEARLQATKAGDPDPLTENPDDIYQAAVTVMMRVVFLLFAEQRDMLPTEQLYWDSYAINGLLDDLRAQAAGGEELLDESYDAWHRLLAVSQALHSGVNYDEMRMPAYGGSLLDPERFPWLYAADSRGLRLRVSDRVMLHVLESAQSVVVKGERRRISFREIDVEQIGYIYEGLLGYSCTEVSDDIVLGLVGKDGAEPEIALTTINDLYDEHGGDSQKFARALVAWFKENQPAATGKTVSALTKLVESEPAGDDRAELVRMLSPVAAGNRDLLETLVSWGNLIRRDLRNIPLVIPVGGLVVIETPSRKNAGAHYTPKSLAEEVVLHALQPLVYEPGPLQTHDDSEWKLKSAAAILELKVADIAAGSGAFLVAAARFLSERLVEAWARESVLDKVDLGDPEEHRRRALREVIARCLYGADINPMAVEMCKLSLWLVSMDKSKPFSFVDDKIFCGNSLLGLTSLDQLRFLHPYPKPSVAQQQLFIDIDAKISAAAHLRRELATTVEESEPMRSSRAKSRLHAQARQATAELRLISDGVIAAGLPLGGKPGKRLDDAYKTLSWQVQEAFPGDQSAGNPEKLMERIAAGLTPTVETDYEQWLPLHWILEAPDVLVDHGGFDAVIGNPPFLSGKKIAVANGPEIEGWVKSDLAGLKGSADLCAHFIRRAWSLLSARGTLGMVAVDRVGQGDTAAMSTVRLAAEGTLYRALSAFRWPGKASTNAALIWAARRSVEVQSARILDGRLVETIPPSLSGDLDIDVSSAQRLDLSFIAGKGATVYGEGFVFDADDPVFRSLPENELQYLRRYINGRILMSGVPSRRWVVDLNHIETEQALFKVAPELGAHLLRTVAPIRAQVTSQVHESRYWAHWDKREGLLAAARSLRRFIVVAYATRVPVFMFTDDREAMFTDNVVIIASDSATHLGALASSIHAAWFERTRTGRGSTSNYVVSRTLRTFPMPDDPEGHIAREAEKMEGARLRAQDIVASVSSVFNQVDDPQVASTPIANIRESLVGLDRAVLAGYGWSDIVPTYSFYDMAGTRRYTIDPSSRMEIRRRLIDLNRTRSGLVNVGVTQVKSRDGQDKLFT